MGLTGRLMDGDRHRTADGREPGTYHVQEIVGKRTSELGVVEYHVRWRGYGPEENTWEPVDNLDAPERVRAFELLVSERSSREPHQHHDGQAAQYCVRSGAGLAGSNTRAGSSSPLCTPLWT